MQKKLLSSNILFTPPFCIRIRCKNHANKPHDNDWFADYGFYHTKTFGIVPRYICKCCGKTFSKQSFSLDYYVKKIVNYDTIISYLVNSSSVRAISRVLRVRDSSIQNRIERMARQFLWIQNYLITTHSSTEDVVADGFESYTNTKYFPNNIHLLVGKVSRFLYFFNHANLRRKGRMTEKQKHVREQIDKKWRPQYKEIENSFGEVIEKLIGMYPTTEKEPILLYTDKKKEYEHALSSHPVAKELIDAGKLIHHQTDSRAARIASNPLAQVNIMDRSLRNDMASFRRKTICQTRDINAGMYRFSAWAAHHNFIKRFKVDNFPQKQISHGEKAGIPFDLIRVLVKDVFQRRLFISHSEGMSGFFRNLWFCNLETPMKKNRQYKQRYLSM